MDVNLFQAAARLTKRELDSRDIAEQRFSFGITYRNNLPHDVFLQPMFAFGTWQNNIFVPYSPQERIIETRPFGTDQHYAMKDDYIDLSGMESAFTGRNMTNKISDTLYMSRAYLKVPAGGTAETGFSNIQVNKEARSSGVVNDEMEGWQPKTPPFLAIFVTRRSTTLMDWKEAVLPPLDLDWAIKSEVFRYELLEGEIYGRLVDMGIEVWGVLLGAAHMTNAWGTWSRYVQGYTNYYEWRWVNINGELTGAPDWWE